MKCPICQCKTDVTDVRETSKGKRRRRECPACGERFTTYELVDGIHSYDEGWNDALQLIQEYAERRKA